MSQLLLNSLTSKPPAFLISEVLTAWKRSSSVGKIIASYGIRNTSRQLCVDFASSAFFLCPKQKLVSRHTTHTAACYTSATLLPVVLAEVWRLTLLSEGGRQNTIIFCDRLVRVLAGHRAVGGCGWKTQHGGPDTPRHDTSRSRVATSLVSES